MRSRADAAPAWLWTAELGGPGETILLDAEVAHHLVRVCRARAGDAVSLTDGCGALARAEVATLRPQATVRVIEVDRAASPPGRSLACGAPEGERADWMVEKLAELGITTFQPLETARAGWRIGGPRLERWRRLARAALGQSRGRFLMEVRPPVGLEAWLAPERRDRACLWVADPEGTTPGSAARDPSKAWVGLIGPSAGFDDRERSAIAARGFEAIRLAGTRLRTETAAIAMASATAAWGGNSSA